MQSGKVVCVDKGESDSTMPQTFKVFVNVPFYRPVMYCAVDKKSNDTMRNAPYF